MPGRLWFSLLCELTAVAAGTVVLTTAPAGAAARVHQRATEVHAFNSDDQGIQPDGLSCSISAGCRGRVVGRTVWTGDIRGTATYVLNFTPNPDGTLSYDGLESITGTVLDCGGGQFDLRITRGVYDPKRNLDSPGEPIKDQDNWQVAAGSGTRDLVGISGRGTEIITEFNNGKTKADLRGLVACKQRHPSSNLTVSGGVHVKPTDAVADPTLCDAQGREYSTSATDYVYSGSSTYYGTFEGTGRLCGHSTPGFGPGNSIPFVEVDEFTGTVHGCGTGSVIYTVHGFVEAGFDTGSRGLPGHEQWQLDVRSATKGLRGLRSGSGRDVGTINPDSSIDAPFVGRVTCVRPSSQGSPRR